MGEVLDVEGTSVEDIMEEDMAIMGGVGGKDAHHFIVHNPTSMYLLGLYGFKLSHFR